MTTIDTVVAGLIKGSEDNLACALHARNQADVEARAAAKAIEGILAHGQEQHALGLEGSDAGSFQRVKQIRRQEAGAEETKKRAEETARRDKNREREEENARKDRDRKQAVENRKQDAAAKAASSIERTQSPRAWL